ncbi:putative TrmH family tRNA/rRNA methyltransferase [bioreactor metagenome]|uniref:Putative TrmH family tRNA/rRNA methyltransferase n=2 Tax=root TaxID=1 RepID=A0A645HF87_9ZZZZ
MGSIFHVPVFQNIALDDISSELKNRGISLYAAHLKGECLPYHLSLQKSCAFLIGNEARGLSQDAANLCDLWVKIPMPGQAESLNASIAAGILLYEVVRQRLR